MIQTVKTPWHLWLVAGLALLWNGFGAFDSFMSLTQGDPYLRSMGMTEAQIAYFHRFPAWMSVAWVVGTWGGLAGAILLLLRRRWALWAFGASFVGVLATIYYTFICSPDGAEVMGGNTAMTGVITTIAVLLIGYAWFMTRRGVLR